MMVYNYIGLATLLTQQLKCALLGSTMKFTFLRYFQIGKKENLMNKNIGLSSAVAL